MGKILKNWHIPVAVLFSIVLIVGAYILARGVNSPPTAQASTESALLQAIATRDSDNDGLTDWEEVLYGTDSQNSDSLNLGMTDGEAVSRGLIVPKAISDISVASSSPYSLGADGLPPAPAEGTVTNAFARNFLSLYLSAKEANGGAELSEAEITKISDEALNSLSSAIVAAPDFKSADDITVSGSGADALKAFAVSAEAILMKKSNDATKSEILYLQDAIDGKDSTALSHIASIASAYRVSAAGLAVLSVPTELANDDLALINTMMRVSEITTDFTRVDTDPMATMLALNQYPQAVLALGTAFINIGNIYKNAGISLPAGTPGAEFVNLIVNVANQQAKDAKKI